jgi:HrpA-like RNA helicase
VSLFFVVFFWTLYTRCFVDLFFIVASALKTLWLLGVIDKERQLTPAGKQMASFPLEPQHACAVVVSKDYGCTSEVLDIVSIISTSSKLFLDISDKS